VALARMQSPVTIFLGAFLLDAILSALALWLPIAPLRDGVAWAVFAAAMLLAAATFFTPQLPKRFVWPPAAFLVWATICGGFPLAFVAPGNVKAILTGTQLALATGLLAWRLFAPPLPVRPAFSWRNLALCLGVALAGLPLVLVCAGLNAIGVSIETSTSGYVKLRPAGLMLEERQLEKDGRRVRLVSMMHIGDKSFYETILSSLPAQNGAAIVLLEGVSDRAGLIQGRFSYAKVATLLGLTSQEASPLQRAATPRPAENAAPSRLEYRRADVDISSFQPLTIDFINTLGGILANPTLANALHAIRDPDSPFHHPHADEIVRQDILANRNTHLIAEIDAALRTHDTVIVPWGALHLPGIEADLKARGFRETDRIDRPIVRWRRTQ
jgi:hypothetical protein